MKTYKYKMTKKVLLVDDDEITHIIGTRLMQVTCFAKEIVTISNGKEAIDYFANLVNFKKEEAPEIIFLDINMPVMNGWDFLENFMNLFYHHFPMIKIFMLSSSVNQEDITRAKKYPPVKDYIIKPLTKESLEKLLSIQV